MFRAITSVVALSFLASCAAQNTVTRYADLPTYSLWSIQRDTTSGLELAIAEAELGVRGETESYSTYLGRRTSAAYGKSIYGRTGAVSGDRNCSDFPSAAGAQRFFLSAGGPLADPHGLDRDGDGMACEWGRTISRIAKTKAAAARSEARAAARRQAASSRCYVGPRGGRYTLTASGNKNYGSC